MTVRHVSCGEFATEGERKAFERISNALRGLARHGTGKVGGSDVEWLVITNLNHVYDRRRRPDEIDMVVVGPTGVYVIEVKPWEHVFLNRNPHVVDMAAARTNDKAKRIKGTLACVGVDAFVTPRLLLTADSLRLDGDVLHGGVKVCGLGDWKALLSVEGRAVLGPDALDLAEQVLAASNHRRRTGAFASVGEIDFDPDDHVIDDSEAPFHRVWRGSHRRRQDKVIVHLYDLSARPARGERITELARRDFEAMQQVQHLDFVPRIYDSFTDHPEYPGEVAFFSLIDTLATPIVDRQEHPSWTVRERLDFALATLRAVDTLHRPNRDGVTAIVHRSLNPATVRVLSTNKPVLVGQYMASSYATVVVEGGTCKIASECKSKYGFDGNCVPAGISNLCVPIGDPSLILGVAVSQYLNDYIFLVPDKYKINYINVTLPSGALAMLDGQPIAPGGFVALMNSGWQIARLPIAAGSHRLQLTQKGGLVVYGYDKDVSYGYAGGAGLAVGN